MATWLTLKTQFQLIFQSQSSIHPDQYVSLWRYHAWWGEECQGIWILKTTWSVGWLANGRQGIHLLTTNTPNGQKVQILLEELKEVYSTEWTTTLMSAPSPRIQVWNLLNSFSRNIEAKEQKQDWFLRLNPNGTTHHALSHRFFPNVFWLVSTQGGFQLSSIITKPHRVQSSKQVPLWSTCTPPTIKTTYLASRTRWSISSLCNGFSFGMVVVQYCNSGFSLRAVPRRRFHVRILSTQLL